MARTTNEFGGGEIVPAIEAITGIQAPIREDFVAVPFGTVNHEHGERRRIQNLANNLKSNSGIERIPFNGIDELDTEQGPNGETIYALNTGDSRIRFVGSGWTVNTQIDTVAGNNSTNTIVRTSTVGQYIEITFYGTALNILTQLDVDPQIWNRVVDGNTTAFDATTNPFGMRNIHPSNDVPNFISAVLTGNQETKLNQVVPVVSGLTAGVHTVRIELADGAGADRLLVYACEVINENAAITQQSGADFDGRVEALIGITFPIKPDNVTATSVNSRTGVTEAFTGTTGARVLNYLTSSGQFKQSFDIADEAPVVSVAGEQEYTILINNGGSTSVTLPVSATTFTAAAYGSGGGGGGGGGATPLGTLRGASGGGGGGAGKAGATYVRTTSTQAETLTLVVPAGGSPGSGLDGFGGASSTDGMAATIITGGTTISSAPGGGRGGSGIFAANFGTGGFGGSAGAAGTSQAFTGWTIGSQTDTAGSAGSAGANNQPSSGGGSGSVGGVGVTPLTGNEGQGAAATSAAGTGTNGNAGTPPGSGGGGGGAGDQGFNANGATGSTGRVYLIVSATSGLSNTDFGVAAGEFTAGAQSGGDVGAPTATFGNTAFDTNRLNQEVIRRINFREFGANNAFATASGSGITEAFTLDDGTTTLFARGITPIAASAGASREYISLGTNATANERQLTFTFVGTGLDVYWIKEGTNSDQYSVSIDGLAVGNIDQSTAYDGILPIVSGLAYGTHIVHIANNANTSDNAGVADFVIYGPKKPEISTLDANSLELSDYNIMADYTASTSGATGITSKGTLGKTPLREFLYTGSVVSPTLFNDAPFGEYVSVQGTTGIADYTFYGTGIEYHWSTATDNGTPTGLVTLDGNTLSTANFSISLNGGTRAGTGPNVDIADVNCTFVPATGIVTRAAVVRALRSILQVSVLDIGVHTLGLMDNASGDGDVDFQGAFVITPIHINEDTLKVGSEGLNNLTIDPVVEEDEAIVQANLGEAKAWIYFDAVNSLILSSYNVSAVLKTTTNDSQLQVYFDKPFKDTNYAALATGSANSPGGIGEVVVNPDVKLASSARIQTESSAGTLGLYAAFFGELIDE